LIDLFNCTPEFNKAIEVTAESRLFYHVVEDDKVAMKLLESVNERSLPGEFNFYPLNRILDTQPREIIDKVSLVLAKFGVRSFLFSFGLLI